jgi:hypothetical protein
MLSLTARKGRIAAFVGTLASLGAAGAILVPSAGAAPPSPPPGCSVVVTTPAGSTGAPQAQANKSATFDRLCVVG